MKIARADGDSLFLSSGLSQEAFAKTNLIGSLSSASVVVHIGKDSVRAEESRFSGTRADDNGIIMFEGRSYGGAVLSDILSVPRNKMGRRDIMALSAYFRAVDFLRARKGADIVSVGAGGVIVRAEESLRDADVLFINGELFEICAQNHRKLYASVQGKYLRKGLEFPSSLLFTRAVVAYKALTGSFPFDGEDTTRRQEDILDHNFAPLRLWAPALDPGLSGSIEAALRLPVETKILAGRRSLSDGRAESERRRILKKAMAFDTDSFARELGSPIPASDDERMAEERRRFMSRKAALLSVKRFFRRNKSRLLASLAALLFASWFVSGILRENARLVTTRGLSSLQCANALYTMIHRMDAPNLKEIISGKETKDLLVKVSSYFVGARQRLEISPDNGTLSPARWFFYKRESKSWMFGITNLRIDGESLAIERDYKTRGDNPPPVQEEDGKPLSKGDEVTRSASYCLIRQAERRFYIERISDTVTLRWSGKQWKVVRVEGRSRTETVKSDDFIEEFHSLMEENAAAPSPAREVLAVMRERYDWLPDERDMRDAAEFLLREYGSVEAERFLLF